MKIRNFLKVSIRACAFLYLITSLAQASQGTYGWAKRMGGTEADSCQGITTDTAGNVFFTGTFGGTVNFGADFGTTDTKTSSGLLDIFITKISANGAYEWTRRMGGASSEWSYAITTDTAGNIYVTGSFSGIVNFGADFGTTHFKTSAGAEDIFITRINADGSFGWTWRIGGTMDDGSWGIVTDETGNFYITGYFRGTVDFGVDFGYSDIKTWSGGKDIFITKVNANGSYGWTRKIGGTLDEVGRGITLDPAGNIYITGHFAGNVNFGSDFGTTDTKTSAGFEDIFVTRVNANSTYGWTKRIGGTSGDSCQAITIGPAGNVYITGDFYDTVNFGADFGITDAKTVSGLTDIFITKITANGGYGWTRKMGGGQDELGFSIALDPAGNIYITGYFYGSVNFGADFGITDTKTAVGSYDIFITKINSNLSYGWTRRIGGERADFGWAIATDPLGNVYVAGMFRETVNFGADFGTSDTKTCVGADDIFVTKLPMLPPVFDGHDFNGDGSSDISVWRPSNGRWYIQGLGTISWGTAGDIPVSGEYDGNNITDIAAWRPANGRWYIYGVAGTVWGTAGDIPVPGNYNGDIDGKTDIAVWRPPNGRWYLKGIGNYAWGKAGDIPVPGNYNADNTTDIAVWRPSNGWWYIRGIGNYAWGKAGDIPVPADYNGDGKTEIAVWRPSNGRWYIKGAAGAVWGKAGDIPVPGDYDGDGSTDIAVWRPSNGRWYIKGIGGYIWGTLGDTPLVR